MKNEEFWAKIIISNEEKKKSTHYLRYRGVDEHEHVRQYIGSLKGEKVSYAEIATAFRYDKRIRRVLYKYIGLLEEYLRAYISNNYSDKVEQLKLSKYVKQKLEEKGELFVVLSELTFYQLVAQIKRLTGKDTKNLFPYYAKSLDLISGDLDAIVTLRNEVSHNRFLLDNKRLKKCSVGDNNCSLWANTINLRNSLPDPFKNQFAKEINECTKDKGASFDNQTEWTLVDTFVITI